MNHVATRTSANELIDHLPPLGLGDEIFALDVGDGFPVEVDLHRELPWRPIQASCDVPDGAASVIVLANETSSGQLSEIVDAATRLRVGGILLVQTRVSNARNGDRALLRPHSPLATQQVTTLTKLRRPGMPDLLSRHRELDAWEGDCDTVADVLLTLSTADRAIDSRDLCRWLDQRQERRTLGELDIAISRAVVDGGMGIRVVNAMTYTSPAFLAWISEHVGVFAADTDHGYLPWLPADAAIVVLQRS